MGLGGSHRRGRRGLGLLRRPLALLGLGVSGAWIGTLTALEPFRPLFAVIALGFLGWGFYRIYGKPAAQDCREGSACAHPRSARINKTVLWMVTAAILGLLAFPYMAPHLFASAPATPVANTSRAVLAVEKMTCASCPVTVARSLRRVPGVVDARATLDPPRAIVIYDPAQATLDDLVQATTNAGYPSSVEEDAAH
ncbi:MAG: mercuric transporter MerT family protein [Acidobacteriota bacterium]